MHVKFEIHICCGFGNIDLTLKNFEGYVTFATSPGQKNSRGHVQTLEQACKIWGS